MTNRFAGKTALVTGGSRGIGRAVVERLAADGAAFIGVHYGSNRAAALESVAQAEAIGAKAVALHAEFSPDGKAGADILWRSFEAKAVEYLGSADLDILINCAGIAPLASLKETNVKIFEDVISINLTAPFFLIQAANPHLREGGRIINFSTALTRIAAPTRAVYAASKGAINALTLALAAEYGPRNITVNAVAPGIIDTDMNRDWLQWPDGVAQAEALSVFSRPGAASEVASLVAYLASDNGRWTTGQVIDVSGGTHL